MKIFQINIIKILKKFQKPFSCLFLVNYNFKVYHIDLFKGVINKKNSIADLTQISIWGKAKPSHDGSNNVDTNVQQ